MRNPPKAEAAIISELAARGIAFRREYPIEGGRYFVDLYFYAERLAVEIDGPEHRTRKAAEDATRDAIIRSKDIEVARFTNREALEETSRVVDAVEAFLVARQFKRVLPSSLPVDKAPSVVFVPL